MKQTARFALFLLGLVIFAVSCNHKQSSKIGDSEDSYVSKSKFAHDYPDFNPETFRTLLKNKISKDSILNHFYSQTEYKPLWTNDTLNISRIRAFIAIIDNAREHGLPDNYFSVQPIASIVDSIDGGFFKDTTLLYQKLSDIEEASTHIVFRYIKGMTFGFLNPKKLFKPDYAIKIQQPDSAFYEQLYTDVGSDPLEAMLNAQPKSDVYRSMQEACRLLLDKKADFESIKDVGNKNYKLGDKNLNIKRIADRLALTGEYVADTAHDSIMHDSLHQVLDDRLMAAINTFRERNSFMDNKPVEEVGSTTIEILNRPLTYYCDKLKANMERYRWQRARKRHNKHIEVNVAALQLTATATDSVPLIMRVCVGKTISKTPLLDTEFGYINLNPKWNVPVSIAKNEIAVLQRKNPGYLNRQNMKIYKGGKEVDIASVDWSTMTPQKFGYMVVQESGPGNSLGRLKFMFNNSFSVYLHDTPAQRAFDRRIRTVSHGCVRVQKPLELAYFCIDSPSDIYKDQIRYSIGYNPESEKGKKALREAKLKKIPDYIKPEEKISLCIDYYTVYTHPEQKDLHYADDIYGYDSIILSKLGFKQ